MSPLRKTSFSSRVLSTLGLILLSACSNPLSSSQTTALQSFHSKNVQCDQMNFADATVTVTEVRAVVGCLDANHEIEAIQTLFNQMSDAELTPITDFLNNFFQKQPQLLFQIRELYHYAQKQGDLQTVENFASKLLSDSTLNSSLAGALKKTADPISALASDSTIFFNLTGALGLLNSKAYQRLGSEYFNADSLIKIADASVRYLKADDGKTALALYQMLTNHHLDTAWAKITQNNPQVHIQNLAHFFEWLFSNERYKIVSSTARSILDNPILCFNGTREIKNPIVAGLTRISTQDSAAAAQYFTRDLRSEILVAHGYCSFSYDMTPVMNFFDQAVQVQGYDEIYTLIQSMIADPEFIQFVASTASQNFVLDNAWLVQNHFFEDLFTLVSIDLLSPLSTNAAKIASFLDGTLTKLSHDDFVQVAKFLQPLFSADQSYGLKLTQTLYNVMYSAPTISVTLSDGLRTELHDFIDHLLQKDAVGSVLDLAKILIDSKKADTLIDQTLQYFSAFFEKGRFNLVFGQAPTPAIITNPISNLNLNKTALESSSLDPCSNLNLTWNFDTYSAQNQSSYFSDLDSLTQCFNANPVSTAAKDLITYSTSQGEYNALLDVQSSILNQAFILNPDLVISTATDVIKLAQNDLDSLQSYLLLSSTAFSQVKNALLPRIQIKSLFSQILNGKEIYSALQEWTGLAPARTRSSSPTLDPHQMTEVNTIVSRKKILKGALIADGLKALFDEYCSSLDAKNANCLIDANQLALYLKSPAALYSQIVDEMLNSSQSWGDPNQMKAWDHVAGLATPTQVSDFEYHLNPTLHIVRGSPEAPQAVLSALKRTIHNGMSISSFIKDRAVRLNLIPYYYQIPTYPANSKREFSDRIHLRLVSDLDRLELIAINADFKPFDVVPNIGMGMLKSIALSWGDIDPSDRPATLGALLGSKSVKTLKETKESMESEMTAFDQSFIQKMGECKVLGKVLPAFCSSAIGDMSARIFNLRSLITLLDIELPVKDGGFGGLEFLRDVFYGLYEGNLSSQRDVFENGVDVGADCLKNPLNFQAPVQKCKADLLTLVPRLTHLGVLHAASLSVLNQQDNPMDPIASIVNRISADDSLAAPFTKAVSDDTGIQFLEDAVDYGFQAPGNTAANLSLLVQVISVSSNLNWVQLASDLIPKAPHFTAENRALLNALLSIDTESFKPWVDHWLSTPTSGTDQLLSLLSTHLDAPTRADAIQLLVDMTPNSNTLATAIEAVKKVPEISAPNLKQDLQQWAIVMQSDSAASTRTRLGNWVTTPSFDQFCGVFSDSVLIGKTYNFLETINQNSDSTLFVEYCKDFLDSH